MLADFPVLNGLVKSLLLPPVVLILLVMVGLALASRQPRWGMIIAWIGAAALFTLSLPIVASALTSLLNPPPPFTEASSGGAQAIVILGGGVRRSAADYGGDTLAPLTLERVRYGARVARVTRLPILVSGGAPQGGKPEALLMRDALVDEFGVPVRWVEPWSRNTHENAVRSAAILRRAGIGRVVLVTHGVDMYRARREFEAQRIEIVPAATSLAAFHAFERRDLLPSVTALNASYHAVYELIAVSLAAVRPG